MVLERTILIVSHEVVGQNMAGPGIRYSQLARVLSAQFAVTLAIPAHSPPFEPAYPIIRYQTDTDLQEAINHSQVILIPAIWYRPALDQSAACLVIDGYDPYLAETLTGDQQADTGEMRSILTQAYLAGDFFLCASERQRDWWLGLLEVCGRINHHTFQEDPSLRRLIDLVPFGLPQTPPQRSKPVMRGVWPGLEPDSRIILWGGGLWPWLDPLSAIRAIAKVRHHRQDVSLVFPGTRHPNSVMAGLATHTEAARRLAADLNLLDRAVFFGDWIPYANWPDVLLESDLALTLHYDTLETRLAFRSRALDYIWAGLPIIATGGDATAELIEQYRLGQLVAYEDVAEIAAAILRLLETPRHQFQFDEARHQLSWERAAQPLIQFCRHPRPAPDKATERGNPFYLAEIKRLRQLVGDYERGRFIRLMRWLNRLIH